jgi:peptidoglycan/xylan/chitin deacetylase (PgdA/CDA1 family)
MSRGRTGARVALLTLCRVVAGSRPAGHVVLAYHSVGTAAGVSVAQFERQLDWLCSRMRIARLDQLRADGSVTERRAVLTFDDGYLDAHEVVAPMLDERGVPGVFFLTGGRLGGRLDTWAGPLPLMTAAHASDLARRGHEIGGHSMTHVQLTRIDPPAADREIAGCKAVLEEVTGMPVTSFAYPKGQHDAVVRDLVARAGFSTAVTTREGHVAAGADWFQLPRVVVNPDTAMAELTAKTTRALELYQRLLRRT